jgi:uncharacterized protein YxeA
MNKTVLAYGIILLIIIAAFFVMWTNKNDTENTIEKENVVTQEMETPTPLSINEDSGVDLTAEEKVALEANRTVMASGNDAKKDELRSVRSSDSIEAIESDISETDLNGIGDEIEQ